MTIQATMTYEKGRKRWFKRYRGDLYQVSCRQLNAPPTRDQSVLAANGWWEAKRQEVDARHRAAQETPEMAELARVAAVEGTVGRIVEGTDEATLREAIERGNAAKVILGSREAWRAGPGAGADSVLGLELRHGMLSKAEAKLRGEVRADRTIGAQVKEWLDSHRLTVKLGGMAVGRYDAYRRHIGLFAEWAGEASAVDTITPAKVEAWWAYLAVAVTEQRYSPAYAKTIFMTAKQWVKWCGGRELIPLPGNIDSRRFKFGDGLRAVERLSLDEVRRLHAACASDRTRLYLLLCLNCGMLQSDISDLAREEVDWKEGTLTRPRSKTPDGPVVRYRLWPETFDLLKRFKAAQSVPNGRGGSRAVLTEDGKQLVCFRLEGEKQVRYDTVQSAFTRLAKHAQLKPAIKLFRKTSASELASHPTYGAYVQYFLGHSPKGVADRHYIRPDDAVFFQALDWLRGRFL